MSNSPDRSGAADPGILGGPAGAGASSDVQQGFKHSLRALRHRNFKLFFLGALISNSGNWLQNATIPFVLYEITGSAKWVGFAAFSQFLPLMLLGPLGGSIADRQDRRRVLLVAQSALAVLAGVLWFVWNAGVRNPWVILLIVALSGSVAGVSIPSWQALVPALVPKEDLSSGITLNSLQFNAARAVGPAIAGALLATIGPSWAFFINAVSYSTVIAALAVIRIPRSKVDKPKSGVMKDFGVAVRYIRTQPGIGVGILVAVVVAALGNPVLQFTTLIVKDVYDAGPVAFGLLSASLGLGAIISAPFVSGWDATLSRSTVVRWALPAYGLSIVMLGLSQQLWVGVIALILAGGGFLAVISTTNTAVQLIVSDQMRGRVMAARVMSFTGAYPIGSLIQGALADEFGVGRVVTVSGSLLVVVALWMAL
ncbi:MAG: MFS transporter, partial [Acidimicrobiales bacterium]